MFSIFFAPENRAVYDIKWKNIVQSDRPKITRRHMHFSC